CAGGSRRQPDTW
nr:immunoglobulin heavy chain junction region [Macaca mulatta]MOX63550.1 immunoglobulin heavy chain junction region [Macaca mulatta]MOX65151.1 immunoglobulin heavy chain junction region [Macaca mulatta]